jgi:hypothetical protein
MATVIQLIGIIEEYDYNYYHRTCGPVNSVSAALGARYRETSAYGTLVRQKQRDKTMRINIKRAAGFWREARTIGFQNNLRSSSASHLALFISVHYTFHCPAPWPVSRS